MEACGGGWADFEQTSDIMNEHRSVMSAADCVYSPPLPCTQIQTQVCFSLSKQSLSQAFENPSCNAERFISLVA